jgi:hypothetical protein
MLPYIKKKKKKKITQKGAGGVALNSNASTSKTKQNKTGSSEMGQ